MKIRIAAIERVLASRVRKEHMDKKPKNCGGTRKLSICRGFLQWPFSSEHFSSAVKPLII
ncbi:MAG TPA: hypothetical protein VIN38_07555 [Thiobacillus sp.]